MTFGCTMQSTEFAALPDAVLAAMRCLDSAQSAEPCATGAAHRKTTPNAAGVMQCALAGQHSFDVRFTKQVSWRQLQPTARRKRLPAAESVEKEENSQNTQGSGICINLKYLYRDCFEKPTNQKKNSRQLSLEGKGGGRGWSGTGGTIRTLGALRHRE